MNCGVFYNIIFILYSNIKNKIKYIVYQIDVDDLFTSILFSRGIVDLNTLSLSILYCYYVIKY